ncbi:ATP-dependent helicase HrpB [Silvibacterium acidisoli]|uniref:ATP-dependent helicase HrpB n=1 Tax=Acidobacteriaceae bacterium ZG23-2 TaxID=2883246 RepID=UPI00406C8136
MSLSSLPIDKLLPEIVATVLRSPSVVLEAAPGAGKTTRVPAALLSHIVGEILVLEPRRIAARMAARRVAEELGEQAGNTVGYTVRFEQVGSERTRLRFITEGVLTRRLQTDRTLRGIGMVILDEFHERHLDTDLALALLYRLQRTTRPDLKLLVMSATLDTSPIAAFLGHCPVLSSEGRAFPLTVEHRPYSPAPLEAQVNQALASIVTRTAGHTLIFLPGAAEIRRAITACRPDGNRFDLELLPLHGDLPPAEQDRALAPGSRRKVIFATNVAESSITIDGVTTVIDSGLARIATTSPWTGLPTLEIGRVSQASVRQRAGRAGRTGPGLAVRLFPEEDMQRRPAHDTPEILRADLANLVLTLRVLDVENAPDLAWLDAPPQPALDAADALLDRLGASGDLAAELAAYPLPPRLARVLTEAKSRGAAHSACIAVALLSSKLLAGNLLEATDHPPSDHRFHQVLTQLLRLTRAPRTPEHNDEALLKSLLAGFPDRVASVRSGRQLLLSGGISAELATDAPQQQFLLAIDAEDRKEKPMPLVRAFAPIEPEWLIDLFPENIRETRELAWHRTAERVDEISSLVYDQLVLSESRHAPTDPSAAAAMLADAALEAGIARFVDTEVLENLLARIEFAGAAKPDLSALLREVSSGLRSFTELKKLAAATLLPLIEQQTGIRLADLAPATLRLQGGRTTKVHYESGKSPWIASRLQDFFGMRETPRIGPSKTPVVLHLLAPNQRAVQTTTDLAGFWERLYPTVRRELMRRYPRHSWPESPY